MKTRFDPVDISIMKRLSFYTLASLIAGMFVIPLVLSLIHISESLLSLLQASCGGVIIAAGYGFYLILMASIFEAAFGVESRDRTEHETRSH